MEYTNPISTVSNSHSRKLTCSQKWLVGAILLMALLVRAAAAAVNPVFARDSITMLGKIALWGSDIPLDKLLEINGTKLLPLPLFLFAQSAHAGLSPEIGAILFNTIFGTAAVYAAYCLAREMFGGFVFAATSALLVAVLPLPVFSSIEVLNDSPGFMSCGFTLYFAIKGYRRKNEIDWCFCWFFAGIMLMCRQELYALPPLIAIVWILQEKPDWKQGLKFICIMTGVLGITLLVLNFIMGTGAVYGQIFTDILRQLKPQSWHFSVEHLPNAVTIPVLIFACGGMYFYGRKYKWNKVIRLVVYSIAAVILIDSFSDSANKQCFIGLVYPFCLFAAFAFHKTGEYIVILFRYENRRLRADSIAWALTAVMTIFCFYQTMKPDEVHSVFRRVCDDAGRIGQADTDSLWWMPQETQRFLYYSGLPVSRCPDNALLNQVMQNDPGVHVFVLLKEDSKKQQRGLALPADCAEIKSWQTKRPEIRFALYRLHSSSEQELKNP